MSLEKDSGITPLNSNVDAIFIVKQIMDKSIEFNKSAKEVFFLKFMFIQPFNSSVENV